MCEFISWIEDDGKVYLFTNNELNTKEGRKIQKGLRDNDIRGHGVIREYWGLKGGTQKECENFSNSDNFPKEIIKAVKLGQYSEIGFNEELLNASGKKEYLKIKNTAWAEYEKIENPALAEYEKITNTAFLEIFKHKKYRNKNWI